MLAAIGNVLLFAVVGFAVFFLLAIYISERAKTPDFISFSVSGVVSVFVAGFVVVMVGPSPEPKPEVGTTTLSRTAPASPSAHRAETGTLQLQNYRFKGDTQAIKCWEDRGGVKCGAAR